MGSYAALWRARLRLMRPGNAAMAAVGVLAGIALAADSAWATSLWFALTAGARLEVWTAAPLAAFLVTGFGNTLNDVVDRDLDRTAHPERPLPSGGISVGEAKGWAVGLLALGLLEAWVAGAASLLAFAAANAGILVLYETWAKPRGLPGNVLVAWLVASTFLFGGFAWHGLDGARAAAPLAAMAGLATMARELLKDIEDIDHDRAVRRTFPVRAGARAAWAVAAAALAAAVAYSLSHSWTTGWPAPPLLWLAVPVVVFAAAIIVARDRPGKGQRLVKLGMALALAVYLLPGLAVMVR